MPYVQNAARVKNSGHLIIFDENFEKSILSKNIIYMAFLGPQWSCKLVRWFENLCVSVYYLIKNATKLWWNKKRIYLGDYI